MLVTILESFFHALGLVYDIASFLPNLVLTIIMPAKSRRKLKAQKLEKQTPDSAYRSTDITELAHSMYPECNTLDDLFSRAANSYRSNHCMGYRNVITEEDDVQRDGKVLKKLILGNYTWLSFSEVNIKIEHFGNGLLALGHQAGQNVCIFAETRYEWMIAAQACFRYNFPVVTLYSTLGEEAVAHGIRETESRTVITSSSALPKLKMALGTCDCIKTVVYFKDPGLTPVFKNARAQLLTLDKLLVMGSAFHGPHPVKPAKTDTAVIMYTSGTTGVPKGVVMSHANMMAACCTTDRLGYIEPTDTLCGYLPLAHVFELMCEIATLSSGGNIGYSSPHTLTDQSSKIKHGSKGDVTVLKPTLIAVVPVIMERLYKGTWEKVNEGSCFKRALFNFAYNYKCKKAEYGADTPLLNYVVFNKVKKILGGNLRLMLSGGAPLSPVTQRFMNVCFCCPILQGYGLTETCGCGTTSSVYDYTTGDVGAPMVNAQIKLRNWSVGGYRNTDKPNPRGEIMIGGPIVSMGYYKNTTKTAEDFLLIDNVWYFCTGDIGEIQPNGTLKIIDRRKDLVKLQAGEYVSLGKVESILKQCYLVDNVCVYADSTKNYPICLITPNEKQLRKLAQTLHLENESREQLCKNISLEAEVKQVIRRWAMTEKLEKFEIPEKIKLCPEFWTPDTGFVTDAFKLKRRNVEQYYQSEINRMYA